MSAPRLSAIARVVIAALIGTVTLVVPSTSAQAKATPCVGLVVNLPDGSVVKDCIPYEDGLTGQQVLESAGLKLAFAKNGVVCQVNGQPDTCGDGSDGNYWSYYHRKPGANPAGWKFSSKGPADYAVHEQETEGWIFVQAPAKTAKPDPVAYDELAATTETSAPATTSDAAEPQAAEEDDDNSGQSIGIWIGVGIAILIATGIGTGAAKRRAKE